MAKERLNAIDVAISVANLKKLVNNLTLVNIYDITNRVFILKFSKNENKIYVLIEIGCRIHATQFLRSVDHLPSNFNAKVFLIIIIKNIQLRKHLRNRRLRDVSQMSQDRIIDFTFSSEEYAHHLVVQLFLPGNIYLTDHEYKVMTVLRPQNTGDKFFKVGTNYIFDMDYNSWFEPVKRPLVEELLSSKKLVDLFKEIFPSVNNSFVLSTLALKLKNEGKADTDSKKLDRLYTMEELDEVYQYVEYVRQHLVDLLSRKDKVPGYVYKNNKGDMEDFGVFEQPNSDYFDDFNDALDAFFTKNELVKQEKKTVDKKPTKLNKIKVDQDKREAKLMEEINKLDKEIKILEENIDISDNCLNLTKALIASGASWNDIYEQLQIQRKQNHPLVKYIKEINIPNQTLTFVSCSSNTDSNMEDNKENTNNDNDNKENDKENKNKKQKNKEKQKLNENEVVLDYGLNSQQNLKNLYNSRKKLENKLERTRIGKEYALKKVTKRLSKQKEEKKVNKRGRDVRISSLRKRFWFEKFYWFITSQGYLVLAGRDSLQNELLVKRYLTKGDLYFHADIHGASSVILKMDCNDFGNNREDNENKEIAENDVKEENENQNKENQDKNKKETNETQKDKKEEKDKEKLVFKEGEENDELVNRIKVSIEEAGSFAVCHSNAWNDRFLVQSWWVYWYQVSKTPPTGEYVPQGSFVIRGKKNYLQPQKLEMGITYLFQVHPFQSLDEENEKEENMDTDRKDNKEENENKEIAENDVKEENENQTNEEEEENEETEESELLENGTENEEEEYSEDDMDEDEESDDDDVVSEEDSEEEQEDEEEDEQLGEELEEEEDENEEEDEKEEEENDKVVRMGNVEMIGEYEANIQRRTRDRKATAHPLKFQLAKLKNQLQKLNLTSTSSNKSSKSSTKYFDNKEENNKEKEENKENQNKNNEENEEETNTKDKGKDKKRVSVGFKDEVEEVGEKDGRSVRIVEPEKLTHTEEAVRKIRQRKLTCLNPNLSKLGNLLKMNSRDKEEEEDKDKKDKENKEQNKDNEKQYKEENNKENEEEKERNSTKEEKEFYRDIEVKKMEHEKEKDKDKEKEKQNKKENNREKQDKVKGSSRMMRFLNQKVNKIKKKYGQDDEETQELRRMLTGSKKVQKQRNSKGAMLLPLEINKPKERFNKENKEIKTLNDRELENYMNQLSCLSRQHKEDDDVLNVIPMCAPYTAIKHYKNTIKLVPGNAKKELSQHTHYNISSKRPDNAHYLKLITTDQLTLTLIGNCKFTNTKN